MQGLFSPWEKSITYPPTNLSIDKTTCMRYNIYGSEKALSNFIDILSTSKGFDRKEGFEMLPEERETIINFTDADKTASIYTFSKSLQTKLLKDVAKRPDEARVLHSSPDGSMEFEFPKSYVTSMRWPAKRRQMTEEEKAKAAERLRNARMAKNFYFGTDETEDNDAQE